MQLKNPKISYAKVGKSKIPDHASHSPLSDPEKDIFAHMNQDNLNYIKKELKLKHKKETINIQPHPHLPVSELNKTQQPLSPSNQIQKDAELLFAQDAAQNEYRGPKEGKMEREESFKSVPSIEGGMVSTISANLYHLREQGSNFIEFLEGYMSQLNNSSRSHKKLAQSNGQISLEHDDSKDENSAQLRQSGNTNLRYAFPMAHPNHTQPLFRKPSVVAEDVKLDGRQQRISQTFGQYTSRADFKESKMDQQLKEEKLNCILLAQELERMQQMAAIKEEIISKLEYNLQILNEEVIHLRKKLDIVEKQSRHNKNNPVVGYHTVSEEERKRGEIEGLQNSVGGRGRNGVRLRQRMSHTCQDGENVQQVQKLERELAEFTNREKHSLKSLMRKNHSVYY